jgi:hypothetical protein
MAARRLLGQTEANPHTRGKINRLPVAFRRSEAYLLRHLNYCVIETVAEAGHHAGDLHLARSEEDHPGLHYLQF